MTETPHVVGIVGSLSDESRTRLGVERVLEAAEAASASTRLIDLREYELPVFDADDRDVGDAPRLKAEVDEADGVILGSPMYHGSFSGVLKNALDYLGKDEFEGTTVGLIAVSGGAFPRPVLEHLRSVSRGIGAWTLPNQVAIPKARTHVEDGELVTEDILDRLDSLGEDIVRYAGVERYPEIRPSDPAPAFGDD